MDHDVRRRPYRDGDEDWWRVRRLLVGSHAAAPPSWNWGIRRWDGARFHNEVPRLAEGFAGRSAVWETADGRLVGAVHPEGERGDEAFLELDPDSRHLQPAMLDWAEAARRGPRRTACGRWTWSRGTTTSRAGGCWRRAGTRCATSGTWLRRLRFGGVGAAGGSAAAGIPPAHDPSRADDAGPDGGAPQRRVQPLDPHGGGVRDVHGRVAVVPRTTSTSSPRRPTVPSPRTSA